MFIAAILIEIALFQLNRCPFCSYPIFATYSAKQRRSRSFLGSSDLLVQPAAAACLR